MERREHKRHRFWLPVHVDGLPTGVAVSHDASDHGLLLVCSETLTVGSTVQVTLRVPPGSGVDVTVPASVVRIAENDEDPDGLWPHKMAVRFASPAPELEAYLAALPSSLDEQDR
jgi:PilZ domain